MLGRADGGKAYFPTAAEHPVIEADGNPRRRPALHHRPMAPRPQLSGRTTGGRSAVRGRQTAAGWRRHPLGQRAGGVPALDLGLAARLEGLRASHSIEHSGWPDILRQQPDGEARYRAIRAEHPPVSHPTVRVEPLTGDKYVFVNPKYVERIHGVSRQGKRHPAGAIAAAVRTPRTPGTAALGARHGGDLGQPHHLHYAVADYLPAYRRMHRVTF